MLLKISQKGTLLSYCLIKPFAVIGHTTCFQINVVLSFIVFQSIFMYFGRFVLVYLFVFTVRETEHQVVYTRFKGTGMNFKLSVILSQTQVQ